MRPPLEPAEPARHRRPPAGVAVKTPRRDHRDPTTTLPVVAHVLRVARAQLLRLGERARADPRRVHLRDQRRRTPPGPARPTATRPPDSCPPPRARPPACPAHRPARRPRARPRRPGPRPPVPPPLARTTPSSTTTARTQAVTAASADGGQVRSRIISPARTRTAGSPPPPRSGTPRRPLSAIPILPPTAVCSLPIRPPTAHTAPPNKKPARHANSAYTAITLIAL